MFPDKGFFVRGVDVLEDVEQIGRIEFLRQRGFDEVMDERGVRIFRWHVGQRAGDEFRIEIGDGQAFHFLLDDGCVEGVAAADLEHVLAPGKHLGGKLVACLREEKPSRVIDPFAALQKPELDRSACLGEFDVRLVDRIPHFPCGHSFVTWIAQSIFRWVLMSAIGKCEGAELGGPVAAADCVKTISKHGKPKNTRQRAAERACKGPHHPAAGIWHFIFSLCQCIQTAHRS